MLPLDVDVMKWGKAHIPHRRRQSADAKQEASEPQPASNKNRFGFQQVTAMPGFDFTQMERKHKMSIAHKESIINMDEHKQKQDRDRHQGLLQEAKDKKVGPAGLLAIHIKKATFHNLDPTSEYEREDLSVYIRIYSDRQLKTTCCYDGVYSPANLVFDDLRHFMLLPTDDRNDPTNVVRLEVAVFDPDTPRKHRILAAKEVHMYDIIKNMYLVEKYEFMRIQTLIAEVDVEMCFSYGTFGYGYSNQFENRLTQSKEILSHSMFPRIDPPPKRQDSGRKDVITCTHVGHPSYIDFTKKVPLLVSPILIYH